ncbi:unnamed protein product [Meloidogyne enterolobii]|uniref:Uncharacterized protein n=1 Tax=Meloidogyne enterolobii TaxID=390850 RepID=A0ACB1AQS5_MELEN
MSPLEEVLIKKIYTLLTIEMPCVTNTQTRLFSLVNNLKLFLAKNPILRHFKNQA